MYFNKNVYIKKCINSDLAVHVVSIYLMGENVFPVIYKAP